MKRNADSSTHFIQLAVIKGYAATTGIPPLYLGVSLVDDEMVGKMICAYDLRYQGLATPNTTLAELLDKENEINAFMEEGSDLIVVFVRMTDYGKIIAQVHIKDIWLENLGPSQNISYNAHLKTELPSRKLLQTTP